MITSKSAYNLLKYEHRRSGWIASEKKGIAKQRVNRHRGKLLKTILLIHGESGSGKSRTAKLLMESLESKHVDCKLIASDDVYIEFIKARYPNLYFEHLRRFIAGHRSRIIEDANAGRTGREEAYSEYVNIIGNWRAALTENILQLLETADVVLAEGCFLREANLTRPDYEKRYRLLECEVQNGAIYCNGQPTTAENLVELLCGEPR